MKINIALNIALMILITLAIDSIYVYGLLVVMFVVNVFASKNIHNVWIISCVQSLILLVISPVLALICIAVANVIYYVNLNFAKRFQNEAMRFILKKIYFLIVIQGIIIALLAYLSRSVYLSFAVPVVLISLITVVFGFWILITKKQSND